MTQYVQAIFTVLSLVNPVICAAIFTNVTSGQSKQTKVANATKATMAIVIILCLAALGGAQVLNLFGISLPAFKVAGGMVLAWMGFIMLRGNASPTSATNSNADGDKESEGQSQDSSITPLILFAASPGTITGVITLAVTHSQGGVPVTALVAVVVALAVTWITMILAAMKTGAQKPGMMHDVSSRFMGLIVLAMGVQFALAGAGEFFHLH